jgi:hypothetical protein
VAFTRHLYTDNLRSNPLESPLQPSVEVATERGALETGYLMTVPLVLLPVSGGEVALSWNKCNKNSCEVTNIQC